MVYKAIATIGITLVLSIAAPAVKLYHRVRDVITTGFSTPTLEAPGHLEAAAGCRGGGPRVALSRKPSPSEIATGYNVFRSLDKQGPYLTIAQVKGRLETRFVDRVIEPGRKYYYVVRAIPGTWETEPSNRVAAVVEKPCQG